MYPSRIYIPETAPVKGRLKRQNDEITSVRSQTHSRQLPMAPRCGTAATTSNKYRSHTAG